MTNQEFDEKRKEYSGKVIAKLSEIAAKRPELRIGQIIDNAILNNELFYMENDRLFALLCKFECKFELDSENG